MNNTNAQWSAENLGLFELAVTWWLHATILLTIGLLVSKLLRRPVWQSVVIRVTFASVLLCPLFAQLLSLWGLPMLTLDVPSRLLSPPSATTALAPLDGQSLIGENAVGEPMDLRLATDVVPSITSSNGADVANEVVDRSTDRQPAIVSAVLSPNSSETTPSSAERQLLYVGWLALTVWAVGSVSLFARLLRDLALGQLLKRQSGVADAQCVAVCRRIAKHLCLRRQPNVVVNPFLSSPCLVGHWRPTILLPEGIDPAGYDQIFLHELAHLRRGDWLWCGVGRAARALLWCQPLIWWLYRKHLSVAEEVCDDYVIQHGCSRESYLQQLIEIAEQSLPRSRPVGVSMVGFHSKLGRRAVRIVDTTRSLSTRAGKLFVTSALLSTLALTVGVALIEIGQSGSAVAEQQESASPQSNATLANATTDDSRPSKTNVTNSTPEKQSENAIQTEAASDTQTVKGMVTDGAGNPIADALIATFPRVPKEKVLEARTDQTGQFSLQVAARNGIGVMAAVYKEGYAINTFNSIKAPIRISLVEQDSIPVRIVAPDGSAIADGRVIAGMLQTDGFGAPPPESWSQILETKSDVDGSAFVVGALRSQLRSITVTAPQWGSQSIALPRVSRGTKVSESFVAKLSPVGNILGKVVDVDGKPVDGREILCVSNVSGSPGQQSSKTKTDALGGFQFIMPVGRYRLTGAPNENGSFEPLSILVRDNKTALAEINTKPNRKVRGQVLTDLQTPAANLSVAAWGLGVSQLVLTDDMGYFEFSLPPGEWSYACSADEVPGYLPRQKNQSLTVDVRENLEVSVPTLIVPTGQIIEGQIRGVDTNESRICVVIAMVGSSTYWCQYDSSGKFRLTLPRSVSVKDVDAFEIRFVDAPIEIVSAEPLILEPRIENKPAPSPREKLKLEMRKLPTASPTERMQLVALFMDYLRTQKIETDDLHGGMQIVHLFESLKDTAAAQQLCDFIIKQVEGRQQFDSEIAKLKGVARRLSLVGSKYQFVGSNVANGEMTKWSDYEGKMVLIQMWATWCGPCHEDLQTAAGLHTRLGEERFKVISVSTDEDSQALRRAVIDGDFPWPTIQSPASDPDGVSQQLGIVAIPYNILIGPDGTVLATNLRNADLERFIDSKISLIP